MNHEVERFPGELKALREQIEKFRTIVTHSLAEKTGVFFVCGASEPMDKDGLPEKILVCPAYGLDGFAIYTKTRDYEAPGY